MNDELFSIFTIPQEKSYCGPCSMSYCFFILGVNASQQEIAAATKLNWWHRKKNGCDERALKRAANAFGIKSEFLKFTAKNKSAVFIKKLKEHIDAGLPAVLSVNNFAHWIALLGYLKEEDKFIVNDPNEKVIFSKYSRNTLKKKCWNVIETKEDSASEYFAILLSNKDDSSPRWTITDDFIKLCDKGSAQNANTMMYDLFEISERAQLSYPHPYEIIRLNVILEKYEDIIVDNVNYWSKSKDMDKRQLRQLYRDFVITAAAANICIPKNFDTVSIVSQMTAILCAALWNKGALI